MSIEKSDDNIVTDNESDVSTAPAAGDLLVLTEDHEFQLTELNLNAGESNVFEVVVRDQGGGNARVASTFDSSSISGGTFDNPVAQAGAGREIVLTIENTGSTDTDYRTNYKVDKRQS